MKSRLRDIAAAAIGAALALSAWASMTVHGGAMLQRHRERSGARNNTFDPRDYPAFVLNMPGAAVARAWTESQLAGLGYTTYTRVNGVVVTREMSICRNETDWNQCNDGPTRAHLAVWRRIIMSQGPEARGYLIVEDDVLFHRDFVALWPRYTAALGEFSVIYVGQQSTKTQPQRDELEVLAGGSAPWTMHAYMVSRRGAAFLARHIEFLRSRAGAPVREPYYAGDGPVLRRPWRMEASETNVDFILIGAHHHYFGLGLRGAAPIGAPWYAFASTPATPAALANRAWVMNEEMEAGVRHPLNAHNCWYGSPGFVKCDDAAALTSPCGAPSGRLPIVGTGLAFQNRCKRPWMLHMWTGEAAHPRMPFTCAALRARIAPNNDSDPATAECRDDPEPVNGARAAGHTSDAPPSSSLSPSVSGTPSSTPSPIRAPPAPSLSGTATPTTTGAPLAQSATGTPTPSPTDSPSSSRP
jgi:hypothetical protein